jgi:hypothetical protein
VPALNLRLATPRRLSTSADWTAFGIVVDGGTMRIGALTRHAGLIVSPEIASDDDHS